MQEYKAIARKYRPQKFCDVFGQDPIVATLKNCIKYKRVAHAFLFSGSRGTGKTTLARLMAKALNCSSLSKEMEPCNLCSSCKEINSGSSLNVLEIDGASHRGIDDIRRITETVGYSISQGSCKVYIIDEVHMLTKEAFNALLKTLEEPPPNAKFIFATTESHKVPKTILSRCQHFHLNRISSDSIAAKLKNIVKDTGRIVTDGAIHCIAEMADGGLRDAESILDQSLSFTEGTLDESLLKELFGWMDKEIFFKLDHAGKEGDFKVAFQVADQLFSTGKDLLQFIDDLLSHFRILTKMHLGLAVPLSEDLQKKYKQSFPLYTKEQLLELFEMLVKAPDELRFHPEPRIALEALLLRILRSHFQIPIDFLVQKLSELEAKGTQQVPHQPKEAFKQPVEIPELFSKPKMDPAPQMPPKEVSPGILKPPVQPVSMQISSAPTKIGQMEETLIQFASIELEGTIKRI